MFRLSQFSLSIFLLLLTFPFLSFATYLATTNPNGCSNRNCYSDVEVMTAVVGLLTATIGPSYLIPSSSHAFGTTKTGDWMIGSGAQGNYLAAMNLDYSEIPGMNWGIKTSLALAGLKKDADTNLRYQLLLDWPVFQNDDSRLSIDFGLGFDRYMESGENLVSAPVGFAFAQILNDHWIARLQSSIRNFQHPIYRSQIQLDYKPVKTQSDFSLAYSLGYLIENNNFKNLTAHYILLGFLL